MSTNSGNAANVAVIENVAVKNNKKNASRNMVNAVVENVAVKKNNASMNVANVVAENVAVKNKNNASRNMTAQEGGVAPVNDFTPYNMRQPSERIAEWASTAPPNAPTLSAAEMRRVVAHGGARKTRKHKKALKHKKAKSHKKGKKGNKTAKKSLKRK